jgi:hypothetical protein
MQMAILYPAICAPGICLGQKWWQTIWKLEFHTANEKAQHALMRGPVLFFRGGGREDFFVFFLVLNVFLSCSNGVSHVLILFLKMFPIEPQIYPIWFAQILILMYIN